MLFFLTVIFYTFLVIIKSSDSWAVIVDTSVFWHNYRHEINALSIYHLLKDSGIPDNRIILMIAEDFTSNKRNSRKGELNSIILLN